MRNARTHSTWGPDGWLYALPRRVLHAIERRQAGAPDSERQRLNAGGSAVAIRCGGCSKIFSEGASNPWGVDFDPHGNAFVTACVIPHLYHVSQGGRYTRQAGQHFNPFVFDDIDTIADHQHFVGRVSDNAFHGPNRDQAPALNADTSALGGGHAHSGLTIHQADEFPATYRGDLLFSNLHGHRVVRERLEREGSGFIARHMPDFALAQDAQVIGVSVIQGPERVRFMFRIGTTSRPVTIATSRSGTEATVASTESATALREILGSIWRVNPMPTW